MNHASAITLTEEQRGELKRRARSQTMDARAVRSALIVLLAADGVGNHEILRRLDISRNQTIEWRNCFSRGGIATVSADLPRSGRRQRIDVSRIVQATTKTLPEGHHPLEHPHLVETFKVPCAARFVHPS